MGLLDVIETIYIAICVVWAFGMLLGLIQATHVPKGRRRRGNSFDGTDLYERRHGRR